MFGIGSTELLVILLVALVVLGPKSLASVAHTLGKAMGEFRRVSTEFQRTLNTEIAFEEHTKKKKEAESELFGDGKTASPVSKPAPETSAESAAIRPQETAVEPDAPNVPNMPNMPNMQVAAQACGPNPADAPEKLVTPGVSGTQESSKPEAPHAEAGGEKA